MEKIDDFLLGILRKHYEPEKDEIGNSGTTGAACAFLIKSEETIISFLNTPDRMELEFAPLNSYFRRILHRLSRRYNLSHRVEATNIFNSSSTLRKVYLSKPVGEDLIKDGPVLKCCDWIEGGVEYSGDIKYKIKGEVKESEDGKETVLEFQSQAAQISKPKFKILKRSSNATSPIINHSPEGQEISTDLTSSNSKKLSLEEREANYQAVRDRIFEGFASSPDSPLQDSQNLHETQLSACTNSQDSPVQTSLFSPLNPDAIPFDFSICDSKISIDHIFLITSKSTSSPLSHKKLTQILSKFPSSCAVIKSLTFPADSCFLLLKNGTKTVESDSDFNIQKWEPEFYLD